MTLRDELEKLIADEKEKADAEARAQEHQLREHRARARRLAGALKAMVDAADPEFVRLKVGHEENTIELIGRFETGPLVLEEIKVDPNTEVMYIENRPFLFARPGYQVTVTTHPGSSLQESPSPEAFRTEVDLCDAVMRLLARHIAERRALNERRARAINKP